MPKATRAKPRARADRGVDRPSLAPLAVADKHLERRPVPSSQPTPAQLAPRFAALVVGLLVSASPPRARAAEPPPYTIAPPSSWIVPIDHELERQTPEGAARSGVRTLLDDEQTRVTDDSVERYHHIARKITSKSGIESTSELSFEVDPPHEHLVLHFIRIHRDGRADDALRPSELHVIQKESDLSQRIYVGTLSIMAFLHDVRAGDVIDYAYSLRGRNPVLGPRFSDTFRLGAAGSAHRLRVRLLTPRARAFTIAPRSYVTPPEERDLDLFHEHVWDRRDVAAIEFEDDMPRWFRPFPRVEVSEHRSWAEVAAWALPLYPEPRLTPALEQQIARLRAVGPDEQARVLAALRFVQDDIRYLGIELGPSSHQPESPAVVLDRRFGDCKDKTRLLVTLLRALGIEADPALVNADLGRGLDERLPSPLAFNHVITRVRTGGRTYWLDPTRSAEHGSLDALERPDVERALVVHPDTRELTVVPPPTLDAPSIEELHEVLAPRYDAPAEVRLTTRFRGRTADAIRRSIESTDRAELSRRYLNDFARDEPSAVEIAPPAIDDDLVNDTLTLVERYRVPDFWASKSKVFRAALIQRALASPRISRRKTPLALEHPTFLTHELRVSSPAARRCASGSR
jgi:hypothetical protein